MTRGSGGVRWRSSSMRLIDSSKKRLNTFRTYSIMGSSSTRVAVVFRRIRLCRNGNTRKPRGIKNQQKKTTQSKNKKSRLMLPLSCPDVIGRPYKENTLFLFQERQSSQKLLLKICHNKANTVEKNPKMQRNVLLT